MKAERILATLAICAVSATCVPSALDVDFNTLNFGITSYATIEGEFSAELSESDFTCIVTDFSSTATTITIPDTIDDIDYDTNETKTYTVVGVDFSKVKKDKVTSVTIPSTVKTISTGCFSNFSKLSSVTFQDGSSLTSIGANAFLNTKLESITLNCKNLTTIGSKALGYANSSSTTTKSGFTIECYSYNKDVVNSYVDGTDITVKVLDETSTKFGGASITLDGKIGINFYMTFSNDVLNDTNSKVVLSTDDGTLDEIPVANWSVDSKYDMYKFTSYVNSTEMDTTVTATLVTSSGSTVMGSSSVNSYIEALQSQEVGNTDLTNLTDSIQRYGECASTYFTDGATISDEVKTFIDSQFGDTNLSQYAMSSDGKVTGLTYGKSSLVLNSGTKIKHYFTVSDGASKDDYTFKVHTSDGTEVSCDVKFIDSTCVVSIDNIDACNLDQFYVLDVVNNSTKEQYTLTYSALSYANIVLNQPTTSTVKNLDTLQYLMKSLYLYNSYADTYAQQQ